MEVVLQKSNWYGSVSEAAELIRNGDTSALELTRSMLDRIEKFNGSLNAFITVTADSALAQAEEAAVSYTHLTLPPNREV